VLQQRIKTIAYLRADEVLPASFLRPFAVSSFSFPVMTFCENSKPNGRVFILSTPKNQNLFIFGLNPRYSAQRIQTIQPETEFL